MGYAGVVSLLFASAEASGAACCCRWWCSVCCWNGVHLDLLVCPACHTLSCATSFRRSATRQIPTPTFPDPCPNLPPLLSHPSHPAPTAPAPCQLHSIFPNPCLAAEQWAAAPATVRAEGARVFDLFATWRMDSGDYEQMVRWLSYIGAALATVL